MKPVAVVGARGMLGRAFCELLTQKQIPFLALDRSNCDLASDDALLEVGARASLVINCAAYTNVDGAETDEQTARRVNGTAVGLLAAGCKESGAPILHFSTDYVFDGQARAPYATDHPRAPLGAYGRSKALGEELLEASGAEHLLVRTSWVYAAWGKNFVRTMSELLRTRPSLKVVADQRGRPTEATALADNAWRLFEGGARGAFHLTDGGECSWFEFAQAIGRAIGSSTPIEPCTTAEFPRPAPRPAYSVLDVSESERRLGPLVPYERQLERLAPLL